MRSAAAGRWRAAGTGYLGWPAGPQVCGLAQGGCGQHFQGGSIYWTPTTGVIAVSGALRYAWANAGWQNGYLGYPTTRMDCSLPSGGCTQTFQGGGTLWTAGTGGRALTAGVWALLGRWGGVGGALGYPTADAVCGQADGGCSQDFQGGAVYSSPASGDHALFGGIRAFWLQQGGLASSLTYPTGEMACDANGCAQSFRGGQVGWTSAAGNHISDGAIGLRWAAEGLGKAALGYPTADLVCDQPDSGCRQDFQNGTMFWSAADGAWPVLGDLGAYWRQQGGAASDSGYPVGEPTCTSSGCAQPFQKQWLAGSTQLGFHGTSGAIGGWWLQHGGTTGALGLPKTT